MFSREDRYQIAFNRITINMYGPDTLAYSVRVLHSNIIDRSAETAADLVFPPLGADARIDQKAVVCRSDSEDILGYSQPVPCSCTGEPAVLRLSRNSCILAGYHLRIYIWFNLVQGASFFGI